MFSAIPKQRLSDSVYEQLMDRIVDRRLAPGSELPAERVLAEQLGVNRGAVREALKRLQQAGLIQIRQGGNSVVLDYETEGGLELLPSLLTDAEGQLNPAVARSIMAMRSSLAPDIAAAAAKKGGAKLADELDDILRKMRAASKDTPQLQALALEFWSKLVNAGGNIAYRLAFNSMHKTYKAIWGLLTQVLEPEFRDFDTLQRLANAVRTGDTDTARECGRRHVEIGRIALEKSLDAYQKALE
ncbi:MAG TPA: GntR family transcriptional regulator [Nevskiales bacterium]|nr:GntR family transcriptional regulator [Nevskiales bacterium]